MGGDTIRLAQTFRHVNAVECDAARVDMLRSNVATLGVEENVSVYHADYLDICDTLEQDLVYVDAPWGGPDYKLLDSVQLHLSNVPLGDVCRRVWPRTKYLVLKVPVNFDKKSFFVDFDVSDAQYFIVLLQKANLLVFRHK